MKRLGLSSRFCNEMLFPVDFPAAVLAQSLERVTAEREVAGSIPGAGLILRVLK